MAISSLSGASMEIGHDVEFSMRSLIGDGPEQRLLQLGRNPYASPVLPTRVARFCWLLLLLDTLTSSD